jgi:hypothetical protein
MMKAVNAKEFDMVASWSAKSGERTKASLRPLGMQRLPRMRMIVPNRTDR